MNSSSCAVFVDINIVDLDTLATTMSGDKPASTSSKLNEHKRESRFPKDEELSVPGNYNMGRRKSNDTVLALISNTTAPFKQDSAAQLKQDSIAPVEGSVRPPKLLPRNPIRK